MIQSSPSAIPREGVTALILAGGAGRRMGGVDKGLIEIDGKPLVSQVADALREQVGEVMVSANRNIDAYQSLGFQVVRDETSGHLGPLAGLLSGLRQTKTAYLATVPCDAPRVVPDLVVRLLDALLAHDADVAVAHDGERLQPVHALVSRDVLSNLDAFLAAGNRKAHQWIRSSRYVEVDFSDAAEYFQNINTPSDHRRVD